MSNPQLLVRNVLYAPFPPTPQRHRSAASGVEQTFRDPGTASSV
jgi:hypothetical protein